MRNFQKTLGKEDWETPTNYFNKLNDYYNFTFDLAASDENAKCNNYFTKQNNSLEKDWHTIKGNLWLNPPYNRDLKLWIEKAYKESLLKKDGHIFVLIPSRTDTRYWHDFIFGKSEITFIKGRLKFEIEGKSKDPAPFPSALIKF